MATILANYGKSQEAIAEIMGIKVGTVKATLNAARRVMRPWAIELLKKYEDADEPWPEAWEPAMRIMTRADKEDLVRQIEERHGPMTAEQRAEIVERKPLEDIPHISVRRGRRRPGPMSKKRPS